MRPVQLPLALATNFLLIDLPTLQRDDGFKPSEIMELFSSWIRVIKPWKTINPH
jgi:hypothetical protein